METVFSRRGVLAAGGAAAWLCAVSLFAQDLEFTGLTDSNVITWASIPGTTCLVQSCSSLTGTWVLADPGLSNIAVTAETTSVQLPADAGPTFVRVLSSIRRMPLTDSNEWAVHNATNTSGLNTKGYSGAAYDGRFIYFAPNYDGAVINGQHAKALRLDTRSGFTNSSSWVAYDASNTCGIVTRGYIGCVFDGRYVYYAPFMNPAGVHGRVLRCDTQGEFTNAASWCAYDALNTGGLTNEGYLGAVFDGRFVYFVPHQASSGAKHGVVLRYDTSGVFTDATSWASYDAGITDGAYARGFAGGVFDGCFAYFVPNYWYRFSALPDGFLRYDTQGPFTNSESWDTYVATNTHGLVSRGYKGGVFDGRYLYFAPDRIDPDAWPHHGVVLRYDTQGPFTNAQSWDAYNAASTDGLTNKGFAGAAFDGRYVFFVPNGEDAETHGVVLRYDTEGGFTNAASWDAYDAGNTGGLETKGYFGAAFDGTYIYFVPMKAVTYPNVHARVLRFRAQAPRAIPATVYGGSFF